MNLKEMQRLHRKGTRSLNKLKRDLKKMSKKDLNAKNLAKYEALKTNIRETEQNLAILEINIDVTKRASKKR